MRAITLSGHGGPEVMTWTEVAEPSPGRGEVLVEVAASAVNRADLLQRMGVYPPPPGESEILGLECSGTVVALAPGVTGWSVGDEVCALLAGGGYAELTAVPAGQLLPAPRGLSLVEAAGLPEVACTVWSNVGMLAGLRAGDVFLVHGGAGGIGTFAIQLGARLGARVICTCSADAVEFCRSLGAEVAVDYRSEDFVECVRDVTGGHGADVILDNMGASYLARNVAALAVNGRSVTIGLQGGTKGELDLSTLLGKRAAVHATSLRARPPAEKAAIVAEVRERVWPLVEEGEVRLVVDRVLPMPEAADAHRAIEAGGHRGKLLLAVPRD